MKKTILRALLVLVGGHLLLGVALLAIEATHGINDENASFAVAIAFYYLNLPTIWLLRSANSATPPIAVVLAMGIAQWTGVALVIGAVLHISRAVFRAITGRSTTIVEPTAPHGPGTAGAAPGQ
jgi:hypothetical protein